MAVRFILGRAGAGKSRYCLDEVRGELVAEPLAGAKLILLVPEQVTLQTERDLVSDGDIVGSTRCEVLSFQRLAQRILQSRPLESAQTISPVARAMILQKLVHESANELHYFSPGRILPGLYQQLAAQIEEFIACALAPADILTSAIDEDAGETLRGKLHDLRLLYERYLQYLDGGFVDPVRHLDHARAQLARTHWLKHAQLWVDGFSRFSRQQVSFLVALAGLADKLHISLLLDPQAPGICSNDSPDPWSVFLQTAQTFAQLGVEFRNARVTIEQPICLPRAASQPSRRSSELAHLERHLFGSEKVYEKPCTHIEIFEAPDLRAEMQHVAQRIRQLVSSAQDPLRYRDIAVITRQLDDQCGLIRTVLDDYDIPCFIDRKSPLSDHAVYALVRAILRVRLDDLSVESVRALLKCSLLPVDADIADQLENYVLGHDIHGRRAYVGKDWVADPLVRGPFDDVSSEAGAQTLLGRINSGRRALIELLDEWILLSPPTTRTGAEWARDLYDTLERCSTVGQLEEWAAQAEARQHLAQADTHRRAAGSLVKLFDDFFNSLGHVRMTFPEFAGSFEAGLAQLDVGLVPPAVDQVLVGSIDRTRHPPIRAAFIIGMNDTVFPQSRAEPQLLSDADRELLNEAGVAVDPPRRLQQPQERLLAYIAMTRPSDKLFLSYRTADRRQQRLEPSQYLEEVMRLFRHLSPTRPPGQSLAHALQRVTSSEDLAGVLAWHLRLQQPPASCDPQDRALWNHAYDRARQAPEIRKHLARALAAVNDCNSARLDDQLLESVYGNRLSTSITALEMYAACPFKYYAGQMLKLAPRPENVWDELRLGSLYHAVLEDLVRTLIRENVKLGDLSDSDVKRRLADSAQRRTHSSGTGENATLPYMWQRLDEELLAALLAQRQFQRAGECRTLAAELNFGLGPDASLPAYEITTPRRRRVRLRGKIDRVDVARTADAHIGFVYDYKRTRSRVLDLTEVYYGLSLQLPVYLMRLESLGPRLVNGPLMPGGCFYLPLIPSFEKVVHPDQARHESREKPFRPRGILNDAVIKVLDRDLSNGESSTVIGAALNKDGTPSKRGGNDTVPQRELRAVLEHVHRQIAVLCDNILNGHIEVTPYRRGREMPCKYCDYRSVCRFAFPGRVRQLEAMKRHEALERMLDGN